MVKNPIHAAAFIRQQQEQMYSRAVQYIGRHGQGVCQVVRQAIMQRGGMTMLLQRLGLMPPNTYEYQLKALAAYLRDNGAAAFLRVAGASGDAPPAAAPDAALEAIPEAPPAPAKPALKQPAPPAPPPPAPEPPAPADPAAPEAPPEPATTPAEWFDAQGRYIGPERRSGGDRRSGIDRRAKIDVVWKNARYGGERRKVIRRRADREAAAREGLTAREFPPPPPKKTGAR